MKIFNKQKGETIVEVLISIAVIGAAVGGAFAIANRSNITVQASKERYQAQLAANGQADLLKIYTSSQANPTPAMPESFCMISIAPVPTTNPQCSAFAFNGGVNYSISIRLADNGPDIDNVYVITVSWDSLINPSGDKVDLIYGI